MAFLLPSNLVAQNGIENNAASANASQPDVVVSVERDDASMMLTVAEASSFEATATGAEVGAFLRELVPLWPEAELITIGNTNEARPMWGVLVEPKVVGEEKPVTVLMLGGIHSGECDGKEALLALARDMALGKEGTWWQNLRLIFVPNFNADGNERRGPLHRPRQEGPIEGMGIRENAQVLDLNRDFVKLESPEVRGLVAALNHFDVDILIDTHTTNGSLHQYQLTYDIPHNPATPPAIDQWLRSQMMPTVTNALGKQGFKTFYYGNFDANHRRWATYGYQPRYSTEYMGLRGRIGILSESYSYASYKTRFEVSYAFVREILRVASSSAADIRQIIDESKPGPGAEVPIRGELAKTADDVPVKGFVAPDGSLPRGPYGAEKLANYTPQDHVVQFWNRASATKSVQLPAAYAIPKQHAWVASRLIRHGVQLHRLQSDWQGEVNGYRIASRDVESEFQGHRRNQLTVEPVEFTAELAAGDYVALTEQPLAALVAHLLEPEADDSLASWNFFDPDLQTGATYPVLRLSDGLGEGNLEAVDSVEATELITLEHVMKPGQTVAYSGKAIRGANWLKGASEYVVSSGSRTFAVDAATGSYRPLTKLQALRSSLADLEAFTADEARRAATIDAFTDDWKFALVSHKNDLYFFNAEQGAVRQLTHSPDAAERMPELNAQGTAVAYVRDNNLWVVDCESTESRQLTDDGTVELLNGVLDWVYQEELYGRGNFKGFWWSPDGSEIAFLQLDQTPVPHYQVPDSIHYGQQLEATRYPKAGEPLPTARVFRVSPRSGERTEIELSSFEPDDRLIGRVSWSDAGELWLQVFNRVQNRQDLVRVAKDSNQSSVLFSEISPGGIEIRGTPQFLPDGDFLWLSDLPEGRTHLFRVSVETGQRFQLTQGDWDVDQLLGISDDMSTAFVTGNVTHPTQKHLLAVNVKTGSSRQVTLAPGTHRTSVDASGRYFIDVFSSTTTPPVATLNSIDGDFIRSIDVAASDRHQFLDVAPVHSLAIDTRDGVPLQAQVMLPTSHAGLLNALPSAEATAENAEPETAEVKKLPVLFYVYGGPQAPTVNNAWTGRYHWWHQMLCQEGFAVVLCDNRSARGRGVKDTWTIRGDLCRVELQDLEDAVSWVKQQPWADGERIGVWGWSYGGYFTSYALTHSDSFRCGIAGAPVTDWRNYDAVYTERYMDLPQTNPEGYESSSSVSAAENLSGRLLIIHGERDDNVHMTNSLQLAYALQKAGKQFDLMIYPKNRHGIVDPDQRYHMFEMMTEFLRKHLADAGE